MPSGVIAEDPAEVGGRDLDLRAHRFGSLPHQGQETVGGPAGDDLDRARGLVFEEGAHQIALVGADEKLAQGGEILFREQRGLEKFAIVHRGSLRFLRGEPQERFDPPLAPLHEERIEHHRQQAAGRG